jgi:hypothetical protein
MFRDGSTVNADFLFYGKSELFDYAMVIFYKGELVDVQFEATKTQKQLEEALGISFSEAQVREFSNEFSRGVEVINAFKRSNTH